MYTYPNLLKYKTVLQLVDRPELTSKLALKADLTGATFSGSISLPKTIGIGLQVDNGWGWRDILGQLNVRGVGANDPTWALYQTNDRRFQFGVNDELWVIYHIPHDYVPGTALHIHTHWSISAGGVTETITWGFDVTYAKSHQQAAYPAMVNTTVAAVTSTTAKTAMLTETPITGVGLLDASLIEPDGLVKVRIYLHANSGAEAPFLDIADLHYQSTNVGTKNKTASFYA